MANLEEYALRRDRGFLVKLVVALLIGVAASAAVFSQLTRRETGDWVARQVGLLSGVPDAGGLPPPAPTAPTSGTPTRRSSVPIAPSR